MATTCRICRYEIPRGVDSCPNCGFRADSTGASGSMESPSGDVPGVPGTPVVDVSQILQQAAAQVEAGAAHIDVSGSGAMSSDEIADLLRNAAGNLPSNVTTSTHDVQILTHGQVPSARRIPGSWIVAFVLFDLVIGAAIVLFLMSRGS